MDKFFLCYMLIFMRNREKPSIKSGRNLTMKLSNLKVQILSPLIDCVFNGRNQQQFFLPSLKRAMREFPCLKDKEILALLVFFKWKTCKSRFDSFFILIFQMLKKPSLMTHIEHTFIEFEYIRHKFSKMSAFSFNVQR